MRREAAQDQEEGFQEEEYQSRHQEEHQDPEVGADCLQAVLVTEVGRAEEGDRTGRSSWRGSGTFLWRRRFSV